MPTSAVYRYKVLSENQLLTFYRYIQLNIPVSIKISNPNLHVVFFSVDYVWNPPIFIQINLFCVMMSLMTMVA